MIPPRTRQRSGTGPRSVANNVNKPNCKHDTPTVVRLRVRNVGLDGQRRSREFRTIRQVRDHLDRLDASGLLGRYTIERKVIGGPGRPIWRQVVR